MSRSFSQPPSCFDIRFGDHECDRDEVLYNIGIRDGSARDVTIKDDKIPVVFKTPTGNISLKVSPQITFKDIKQEITDELGFRHHDVTIRDSSSAPVSDASTLQQWLAAHPHLKPPYEFLLEIILP